MESFLSPSSEAQIQKPFCGFDSTSSKAPCFYSTDPPCPFYTLGTNQLKVGLVIWSRCSTCLGRQINCDSSLCLQEWATLLCVRPPRTANMWMSAHPTLLSPDQSFYSSFKTNRICSQFPRQTTTMLFLSNISFCLLILILLVHGSVLLQGFIANRKNNIVHTFRS